MIVALKTDTPVAELYLYESDGTERTRDVWEAGRSLARDLLSHIDELLSSSGADWDDVSGLVVFRGPGSFTGLRIGITTANTIAYAKQLPIVGVSGEGWAQAGVRKLHDKRDDKVVLPEYGADPRITLPKK